MDNIDYLQRQSSQIKSNGNNYNASINEKNNVYVNPNAEKTKSSVLPGLYEKKSDQE